MQQRRFILFDDYRWEQLLPLTFTRPVAALRIGIDTIAEKWEYFFSAKAGYFCENYLEEKYPNENTGENTLHINGGFIPDTELCETISKLKQHEVLMKYDDIIAFYSPEKYFSKLSLTEHAKSFLHVEYKKDCTSVNRSWDIFELNDKVLRNDFERITKNKTSQNISSSNTLLGKNVFIGEGAVIEASVINSLTGPVYIGKNTEIMEGCTIRGPFALGEYSTIKMGAKIYGATTIGPHCKAGGEINNSVLSGYSNKAHDGFLGNSVIGEWCNLGAGTNNSNLKNNYAQVKMWDYVTQKFIDTQLQFCGLIMGDHSKCGINTMFNTGTVVGVSSNIFGDGFPRNFIPSFSWGGAAGFTEYKLHAAFEVAEQVMKRRNIELNSTDKKILTAVYEMSERYRKGHQIFFRK